MGKVQFHTRNSTWVTYGLMCEFKTILTIIAQFYVLSQSPFEQNLRICSKTLDRCAFMC
jgi:hypothetical protein